MPQTSRYALSSAATTAPGWSLERATPPSRLFGANGLRTGPDGRIYVAQVTGSQVSAIDPATGAVEVISPMGDDIVAPDDLAFDEQGNLYVTELTEGRVSMIAPNGSTRIVQGDVPLANPITCHQGRLIAGECRPDGRIMEIDRESGATRLLLDKVPMPNAFAVGPDGKLYFPVMGENAIWRMGLDDHSPEVVARDLGVPVSVKFDAAGFIVSTQVASGQVLRIDPRTGAKTVLADIAPGLDNCTFVGDRLFVSSISGQISEILGEGRVRALMPDGLQWPLGLALGADGVLFVADAGFSYVMRPGGGLELAGMIFTPGYPVAIRGVAAAGPGEWIVTTASGGLFRFRPDRQESEQLVSGLEIAMGVAITSRGAAIFADLGTGQVQMFDGIACHELARDLASPTGVAIDADDSVYVAEMAGGRVVRLRDGGFDTVIDGLVRPEGIALSNGRLYIVDTGTKQLIRCDPANGARDVIAANLPVGAPPGVIPKPLGPVGTFTGPQLTFAGIAPDGHGGFYVSGDAEGSILRIRSH